MFLSRGEVKRGIGGGLCQLSNLMIKNFSEVKYKLKDDENVINKEGLND